MKQVNRKQTREAIESIKAKGITSSLGIPKVSGLTKKQKRFAEAIVIDGLTASGAYRAAYDTKAKSNTVNVEAHKLMKNPKVANTIAAIEEAQQLVALHSAEALKAIIISTLTDVATNSDRDSVRVAAVKVLGTVVGVDMFRETKRVETVQDSGAIRSQILDQLKSMMLSSDDAVDVDASDLLTELVGAPDDPTVPPPCHSDNGTPTIIEHTIPLEQSEELLEDPPSSLESSTPQGDIFLEDEDSYQKLTVSSYSKQMTTK
jgi:phage terminase small subunit